MYPKKFTFDAVTVARARLVTLRAPNLNVLLPENRAEMPGIAHFLEGGFKARDKEDKLLLPDLSALSNTTVGIFSDYAGESAGQYLTYSFLVCAFGTLGPFQQQMAALRKKADLGQKEIAFKDFGMGQLRRMLPSYLRLIDQYVLGLVFTLVVDKSISSLFGPPSCDTATVVNHTRGTRLWQRCAESRREAFPGGPHNRFPASSARSSRAEGLLDDG